jgi:hypothetical protein
MSQGFIKTYREKAIELLEEDPQAYLLLSQIALRARRKDAEYSRTPLKANQAFLGDHKKAGLSQQQYKSAKKRLAVYGLATFEPTNKGTIATLTSTEIFDINADQISPSNQPPNSPMKTHENEPTKNQPETIKEPASIQQETIGEPLTRKEEFKNAKNNKQQTEASLYGFLQNHPSLSVEEKQSLMRYTEDRVAKAIEWASKTLIKTTLIQALHWHCKHDNPPSPTEKASMNQTDQQKAAWDYNRFLEEHRFNRLVNMNQEAIPSGYANVILDGIQTTITLNNPLDMVKNDLRQSMKEILHKSSQ